MEESINSVISYRRIDEIFDKDFPEILQILIKKLQLHEKDLVFNIWSCSEALIFWIICYANASQFVNVPVKNQIKYLHNNFFLTKSKKMVICALDKAKINKLRQRGRQENKGLNVKFATNRDSTIIVYCESDSEGILDFNVLLSYI